MEQVKILCFTEKGQQVAEEIRKITEQAVVYRCGRERASLQEQTEDAFTSASIHTLIFVGATGIAVRAIAPHLKGKDVDPAVLVVDETARFVISLLSGHLGGANRKAEYLASMLKAEPVITTATDLNGSFAVDVWAKDRGLTIRDKRGIKRVSSRILAGDSVSAYSALPLRGKIPEGIELTDSAAEHDLVIDYREHPECALQLVPHCLVLGIGCRKGTSAEAIKKMVEQVFAAHGLCMEAIVAAASIDVKKEEPGLVKFCEAEHLPFTCYSAEELLAVEGDFTASEFVRQTVGVDNVCERSAVRCALNGTLLIHKQTQNGVTLAVAVQPGTLEW